MCCLDWMVYVVKMIFNYLPKMFYYIGFGDQISILLLSWLSSWWKDDWWWLSLKFVTFYKNEEYFCFLQVDDNIKEMLVEFLQIIVGANFLSSQDYATIIMFEGRMQPYSTIIKDFSKPKKGNILNFIMRSKIKTRSLKSIKKLRYFKVNRLLLSN